MCPCVATNRHSANACLLLLIFAFNMCWVSRLSNDRSGLQSSAEDDEVPWQSKRQATCKKVWQLLLCECCGGACKSAHFFVRPKRSPCTGCSRCLSSMPSHHLLAWPKYFVLTPYVLIRHPLKSPPSLSPSSSSSLEAAAPLPTSNPAKADNLFSTVCLLL